ncbi:predicted protein [Botrytis cinerea T4]|uniref:Uncharacterized protein n=1 Tax=Botryotinia fuckeliana (strain T4) TaxID=999810 RepID=G2XQ69_BOTF4|nr:predicted protein [Botrytis cinerea T4]
MRYVPKRLVRTSHREAKRRFKASQRQLPLLLKLPPPLAAIARDIPISEKHACTFMRSNTFADVALSKGNRSSFDNQGTR